MTACVVKEGASAPLGATLYDDGVNFSVFSKSATLVELLLFDDNTAEPAKVIPLDPNRHRTYHYWHVFVPGLRPGQIYAYRIHAPSAPEHGFRFDGEKSSARPLGSCCGGPQHLQPRSRCRPGHNAAVALKSIVADPSRYDREGERPLKRPSAETVIYELHVRVLRAVESARLSAIRVT